MAGGLLCKARLYHDGGGKGLDRLLGCIAATAALPLASLVTLQCSPHGNTSATLQSRDKVAVQLQAVDSVSGKADLGSSVCSKREVSSPQLLAAILHGNKACMTAVMQWWAASKVAKLLNSLDDGFYSDKTPALHFTISDEEGQDKMGFQSSWRSILAAKYSSTSPWQTS